MTIFMTLALLVLILAGLLFLLLHFAYRLWRKAGPGRVVRQLAIITIGLLVVGAPYIWFKREEHRLLLANVPAPLEVAAVEYRLEERWGLGIFPGDNETGFIVYRLTNESASWTRVQGQLLREKLSGGIWYPTPVKDAGDRDWHPYDHDPGLMSAKREPNHPPTVQEFLEKYGFTIPIEPGRDAEADRAIQSEGSLYSYGRGGSVTIVDPLRGKVYFAYAG